ncbi:MAG TPA: multidrug efflux RND transporter permease subunit [Candidatus Mailhella merdigallinarum]|uniref:Multidrug efflux RND transporter permease subunit n=1 Tax=Candidatus Mailhella merdigallinarum TaxID=2838658 RepID=A0A9D2HC92_9BACT|nr:multidrug efflux RND transporter permease subunit [Desulfovibrionaceae bacterium]HJA08572.1 multidrug efflux RND transporter permease subunit [Candidatus Mailhella merdigallinarum]
MDTATTPTKAVIKEGFFLRRPVFSAVLSIFFVIMGLMALRVLPVSQYPDLVPPTVMVMAQYPGASPETIAQTVATPLEQQINGVDDMIYMNSVSSVSGVMLLTVYFEVGTDPDMATVNVNNRVQAALAGLPEIVRQYGVTVMKRSSAILEMVTLSAADDMYDTVYLNNYATINIVDGLKRIPGVGNAEVLGSKDWAMRIWLNPLRMAELNLSTADIAQAVRDQNNQYSAGTIGAQPGGTDIMMTWQVSGLGRLLTAEEFGNIIIRTQPGGGGVLRLKDVARVELGAANYDLDAKVNGVNAVPMAIYLASGANALDTADRVAEYMQTISQNFPVGLQYEVPYDTTTFVRISIEEVIQTLIEAIVLVFLVVFLFLQKWRATLIPCLAVPIALIGTFAGIYALGFSINTLTLFALVLAIGIVVDDAIVVMENMTRVLETEDLTPRQATAKAMSEVTAPVIAIVLVLCAVFIPVGFLGGLAGVMYRQFAITIAISVIISGIVALTLTPALCVLLIRKSTHEPRGFFKWFNAFFAKVTDGFTAGVKVFLRSSLLTLSLMAALLAATWGLFERVPTALVPEEDQGALMVMAILPDGTALPQTQALMNRVADQVEKLKGVKYTISLAGFDMMNGTLNPNNGAIFLTLDDWSERDAQGITVEDILKEVYVIGMAETKGLVLPFNPPPIVGLSNTGGFEMMIESTSGNDKELSDVTRAFLAAAAQRPELTGVSSSYSVNAPRLFVDLDREKARLLNVNVSDVFNTLGATLGATYINDFNREGRTFRVFMQADAAYRSLPDDIKNVYVRSMDGKQIPMVSLVSVRADSGPQIVTHFNGLTAAKVTGNPASGYSSGQAIAALQDVARQVLPQGYTIAWSGSSYQEVQTGGTDFGVLGLSLLMVFLILAAQYERWSLPLAVLSAVPFAVFGAILGNWLTGLNNDVYTQVAMITLLGLACKNAILIVEFAADLHKQGMDIVPSAIEAARLRFRPIIMTSIAFILGTLPLAVSTGAGAGSRRAIGVSVVSGMLAATILAPLIVPYFYRIVMQAAQKVRGNRVATPTDEE